MVVALAGGMLLGGAAKGPASVTTNFSFCSVLSFSGNVYVRRWWCGSVVCGVGVGVRVGGGNLAWGCRVVIC